MVPHFVIVKRVQRVPQLQHHVVRNVDDVADAGDAGRFEPVFQPFRRRLDFHVSNDPRGEAAAEFRRLDFDFDGVARFRGAFRRFRRNRFQRKFVNGADLARDSQMAEAVGAIGTDFCVNHRAVRAVFDSGDVRAGKGKARGKVLRRRRHVDEIFQPAVNNLHDPVPTCGSRNQTRVSNLRGRAKARRLPMLPMGTA